THQSDTHHFDRKATYCQLLLEKTLNELTIAVSKKQPTTTFSRRVSFFPNSSWGRNELNLEGSFTP
ncbi:hypothetical protein, partial [Pseudoalteromonas sp. UBA6610]